MDKPVAFLNALSSALIDAIPLSVLSQLRNFLWLWSPGFGTTENPVALFAFLTQMRFMSSWKESFH